MIDLEQLKLCHNVHELEFMELVVKTHPNAQYYPYVPTGRQLIYINNNSPILAIAHLDGTMPPTHFAIGDVAHKPGHTCIFTPMVDDRLGAYTLLHLLPKLGINCDILLSEGEEIGDPTSQWFFTKRKYNWMFQFDRMGTDVVHYQYRAPEWLNALGKYFSPIKVGAFSDIAFMDHLNIQGVNIGTGYYDYTDYNAWASLNDLVSQAKRFKKFYDRYKDVRFGTPHYLK
jgi:hypothetical protein